MKKIIFFTFCLLPFFKNVLLANKPTFQGNKITPEKSIAILARNFKSSSLYEIKIGDIMTFLKGQNLTELNKNAQFELRLGNEYSWDMFMELSSINTSTTVQNLSTSTSDLDTEERYVLKGHRQSNLNDEIRLVISEGFIGGFIEDGHRTLYIEPLSYHDKSSQIEAFVIYEESNTIQQYSSNTKCGVSDNNLNILEPKQKQNVQQRNNAARLMPISIDIATDYSMLREFNFSTKRLYDFLITNMNNVEANYDNEFKDKIFLSVSNIYISTCDACDPWSKTDDASLLLDNFAGWGKNNCRTNRFGYLGQLWTTRDIQVDGNNGVIGIANIGEIRSDKAYHVLEHYIFSFSLLRSLTTHEIGHNFDAKHDFDIGSTSCPPTTRSGYIMDPQNVGANTWSRGASNNCDRNSIQTINDFYTDIDELFCPNGVDCGGLIKIKRDAVDVQFNIQSCLKLTTILQGLTWVREKGVINIQSGTTPERITISYPCTLKAQGGRVIIGH
jgi:Metallo-peptidase family M12